MEDNLQFLEVFANGGGGGGKLVGDTTTRPNTVTNMATSRHVSSFHQAGFNMMKQSTFNNVMSTQLQLYLCGGGGDICINLLFASVSPWSDRSTYRHSMK